MKPIKTGVVGYGFSGKIFQCPFIDANESFELTAVLQRHGKDALNDYPSIKLYQDYSTMLEDDDLELIIIATPAHLHFKHAMLALGANKHVVVEKPFATTKEEAKTLVAEANKMKKLITVYHNRRFDSDFLTIKELLDEGVTVYEYEAVWDRLELDIDQDDWHEQGYEGSDLLFDLGPHLLDQALHLFGEPDSLYGIAKSLRPQSKITDFFSIELNYPNKVIRLKSSMHASKQDVRYKIHTDKGTYYFYKMDKQEDQLLAGIRPLDKDYGDSSTYDLFDLSNQKTSHQVITSSYISYFDMLAKAIRQNGPLPVSTKDAINVIGYLEDISNGEKAGPKTNR